MKLPRAQIYLTLYSCWINYLIINFLSLGWNSSVKHLNSLVPQLPEFDEKIKKLWMYKTLNLKKKKPAQNHAVVIASVVSINVGIAW